MPQARYGCCRTRKSICPALGGQPSSLLPLKARPIIARRQVSFRDGHADAVAETLPERSSGYFDARCELTFRMAGGETSPLSKLFDLLERQIVTGKMKHTVKQHRGMTGGKHEAVAIRPRRIMRVMA